ncbi:hypothetical protein [Streptomyces sp. NPDC002845]
MVDASEPGRYRRPPAAMETFLDGVDTARPPVPAKRALGVHPYLITPEHTRRTREEVGDGARVLVEQTVILCADAEEARAVGTDWLRGYLDLPPYADNVLRLGFSAEDIAQHHPAALRPGRGDDPHHAARRPAARHRHDSAGDVGKSLTLYVVVTTTIVMSPEAVGNILVLALLITPAGLYVSYACDLAAGGSVVVVRTGLFAVTWRLAPRHGLLTKLVQRPDGADPAGHVA